VNEHNLRKKKQLSSLNLQQIKIKINKAERNYGMLKNQIKYLNTYKVLSEATSDFSESFTFTEPSTIRCNYKNKNACQIKKKNDIKLLRIQILIRCKSVEVISKTLAAHNLYDTWRGINIQVKPGNSKLGLV
jgi:hypothetical protein